MDDDEVFAEKMRECALSAPTSMEAIRSAALTESRSTLRYAVSTAYANVKLGVPVADAFRTSMSAAKLRDRGLRIRLMEAVSGCDDARAAMLRLSDEVEHSGRLRLEIGFGSVQKYMTLSLLSSVILPSLALFGFVGYSMLYSSAASFAAFSMALIMVFPLVYALLRRKMSEVYG